MASKSRQMEENTREADSTCRLHFLRSRISEIRFVSFFFYSKLLIPNFYFIFEIKNLDVDFWFKTGLEKSNQRNMGSKTRFGGVWSKVLGKFFSTTKIFHFSPWKHDRTGRDDFPRPLSS